ncbi:hypothetical protein AB0F46_25565 [Streptomyces sp. NPDC026665]|uniref:hypothetical protein n=1 Tax=Streptomyces sp. NPDC026665 TaxID=3154798 RepID=UPI0033E5755A
MTDALLLLGVPALVVGGCVCAFWAARGGPRWVRVVATVMLTLGGLLDAACKCRRRHANRSGDDGRGWPVTA